MTRRRCAALAPPPAPALAGAPPAPRGARPLLLVAAACAWFVWLPATACELVLTSHRSGHELLRLPLDSRRPELHIAFEHSVLGTTVVDHYVFRPQAWLVEERFEGQGYGLPHSAGPGERLVRSGAGWRLLLDRAVHPLVVRPMPAQRMRLLLGDGELLLSKLSAQAIELQASGCPGHGGSLGYLRAVHSGIRPWGGPAGS